MYNLSCLDHLVVELILQFDPPSQFLDRHRFHFLRHGDDRKYGLLLSTQVGTEPRNSEILQSLDFLGTEAKPLKGWSIGVRDGLRVRHVHVGFVSLHPTAPCDCNESDAAPFARQRIHKGVHECSQDKVLTCGD